MSSFTEMKTEILGGVATDANGETIHDATAPKLIFKTTPYELNKDKTNCILLNLPLDNCITMLDRICFEDADIITSRNSLRNIARTFLFSPSDYYFKVFSIRVGYIQEKVLLHRDGPFNEEGGERGYGFRFEEAMTMKDDKRMEKYHRFISSEIDGIKILTRFEIDCVDPSDNTTVELKTRKRKVNKRGGFHPILQEDYLRELWLQMLFSHTKTVVKGVRDESGDKATIVELKKMSIAEVEKGANLSPSFRQSILLRVVKVLKEIKEECKMRFEGMDENELHEILYTYDERLKKGVFRGIEEAHDQGRPSLSPDVVSLLATERGGKGVGEGKKVAKDDTIDRKSLEEEEGNEKDIVDAMNELSLSKKN